jgi:hypothetical protein
MLRSLVIVTLLALVGTALSPACASADWWPFGKTEKKSEFKNSASTAAKPKPTTQAKKSSSWSLFSSNNSSTNYGTPYSGVGNVTYGMRKEPEKKSWFSSWFKKEEPKRLNSIDDFMALERPSP